MPIEWTGLGPELLLRLDRERPEPLRAQLEGTLREAIRSGRLAVGERLPSSRALAQELAISRGLVVECYAQLESEGFLVSRVGSATRVAAGALTPAPPAPAPAAAPRPAIDFRSGVPDLSSFPRRDWLWALGEACRDAPVMELDYGPPQGSLRLREVLAAYLRRVRGAVAEPGQTVVCAGFAQGVNLVFGALADRGIHQIAVEDPGDAYNAVAGSRAEVRPVPVPVDERGIDVAALVATDARAVVLTPAHQSPTGVVLAPERRHALLAWARERDAFIIEDDYDAEFRYDREPVGALQGLGPDRVVLLGTVSKSLAPTLRLGWLVCPAELAGPIGHGKRFSDRGSPGLDQLALATLIESGRYDRHLRRMRIRYGARRAVLVQALGRHAPHIKLTGLAAGFHAIADLPDSADEQAVIAAAAERSVGLHGMSGNYADGRTHPCRLVLGFGNLSESAIGRGIETVADLFT